MERRKWKLEELLFVQRHREIPAKEIGALLERSENAIYEARYKKELPQYLKPTPERFSKKEKVLRIHALMARDHIKLKEVKE